jgi:hypothetical protein
VTTALVPSMSVRGNALLMLAAINPAALAELIMRAVREAQPLSQAEHADAAAHWSMQSTN